MKIIRYLYRNSVYFKICCIEFDIVSSLGDVCYTGCILVEEENTMVGLLILSLKLVTAVCAYCHLK